MCVYMCVYGCLIVILHSSKHTFLCVHVRVQGGWARLWPRPFPGCLDQALDQRLDCICPLTLLSPTKHSLNPGQDLYRRGTSQTVKSIFQGKLRLRARPQLSLVGGSPISPLSPMLPSAQSISQALRGTYSRSFSHTHLRTHPQPGVGWGLLPPQLPDGRPVRLEKAGRLWRPTRQQFRPQRGVGINK